MKTSVTLLSILLALTCILGFASFMSGSSNSVASSKSLVVGVSHPLKTMSQSDNSKVADKTKNKIEKITDKVYNDGTTSEDIAQATKNIEYNFASSAIRPIYNNSLDKLAKLVIEDKYVVSLRGNADSVGSYKPNWVLSEKRANKVKDYLLAKGVEDTKIITIPFGSTVPIATNKTAAGRQKNRRVEIKLKQINE